MHMSNKCKICIGDKEYTLPSSVKKSQANYSGRIRTHDICNKTAFLSQCNIGVRVTSTVFCLVILFMTFSAKTLKFEYQKMWLL